MDFKRIALVSVIGTATALAGCSGGGNSSSSDRDPSTQSGFTFTVNENYTGSNDQSVAQNLLSYIVSPAFAAVSAQNIQVVSVDAEGKITAVLTPKEGPTDLGNGQFRVVLNEGEAVNHVIVVNPDGPLNLQVGQTLNPAAYLFMPAVEDTEVFEVSLASTIAYQLFLQEAESFDNISAAEVDRIMDSVVEKMAELDLTAANRAAMVTLLLGELKTLVQTQTKLAALNGDGQTPDTTGTIEGDRAKIKNFFDDVNTIATLSSGLADDNHQGAAEELYGQVNAGQQIWQASAESLEDFAEIQAVLSDALMNSESGMTQNVGSLFTDYPEAQLTGSIVETETQLNVTVTGRYGVLTAVDLALNAAATTTTDAVTMTINGKVESAEAIIDLQNAQLDLRTSSGIATSPDSEAYADELVDKLDTIELAIDVALTAKDLSGDTDGTFDGSVTVKAVRTNEDWVEFAGEEAQPYFNVERVTFDGRFELGDEYLQATVTAEQPNARLLTPLTQTYLAGNTYTDLFSYSYDGASTFTFHQPDGDRVLNGYIHNYEVLTLADTFDSTESYNADNESFSDYIRNKTHSIYYDEGYYAFEGQNLTQGSGTVEATNTADSSDTAQVSYVLESNRFQFYIDQFDRQKTYELDRVVGFDATVNVVNTYGYKAYTWDPDTSYPYARSLAQYMANNNEFFYTDNASYQVQLSDLVQGTVDGIVTATLNTSWGDVTSPSTIEVIYDYTNEGYVINKGAGYREISRKILGVNRYEALAIDVSRYFKPYLWDRSLLDFTYTNWADHEESFEDYLTQQYFTWNHWEFVQYLGEFDLDFGDTLMTGQNTPISAYMYWSESMEGAEHPGHYADYKISATLSSYLTGLGDTQVSASFERTGVIDAVASFTLSNQFNGEQTNLNSEITLQVSAIDGELASFVVSNKDGLSVSNHDIEENEDGLEVTFGLETAVVQEVDTGLKVTFSDGTFYLY